MFIMAGEKPSAGGLLDSLKRTFGLKEKGPGAEALAAVETAMSAAPETTPMPAAPEPAAIEVPAPAAETVPAATAGVELPDWLQGEQEQAASVPMAPPAAEAAGKSEDDFGGYKVVGTGIQKKDKLLGEIIGPDGSRFMGMVKRTSDGLKVLRGAVEAPLSKEEPTLPHIPVPEAPPVAPAEAAPAPLPVVEAPAVEVPAPMAAAAEVKVEDDPFATNREFNGYMGTILNAQQVLAMGVELDYKDQKKALIAVAKANSLLPKLPPEVLKSVLLMRAVASRNPKFGRDDFQKEMLAAMDTIKAGTTVKG
jgi:hypothetical protein